ncbi:MAG: hypothetical protein HGA82_02915, partial [Anaerolineales bacterium]|nr:hypothetical protein [Anaerolineales bacterium]
MVSARRDFEALVTKDKVRPLTFTFTGLIYPNKYKSLELVPFFTIHGARYMIYWPVISPDSLKNRTSANRVKEQAMFVLAAHTIDYVAIGEQQPEAEHNFRGEGTDAGIHNDRRWRHASGCSLSAATTRALTSGSGSTWR